MVYLTNTVLLAIYLNKRFIANYRLTILIFLYEILAGRQADFSHYFIKKSLYR